MEELCSIKGTDDGKFVLSVMPKRKKEKSGGKNEPAMVASMEEPKTYVAADMAELHGLIDEYVGGKKKSESDKFKKGFQSK
jgi:hypothetical protein